MGPTDLSLELLMCFHRSAQGASEKWNGRQAKEGAEKSGAFPNQNRSGQ
jgi:hypothetical protein